jgi:glutathione S-transferase
MPVSPNAKIEVTGFNWVPEGPRGLVKDLRVRWALEEAGLDYRFRGIGLERPADYRQDQPFEQVPCFNDGKVRIFESGAIVQYVAEKSEALLPADPQERYRAIQWSYAALSSIEPFVQFRALLNNFWADLEWAPGAKPTFDHYAKLRLDQLSERLGDKQWLEGDRFTIGDLMMVSVLRIADRGQLLGETPNLTAYVKRGEARPAFQRALNDQLATYREHEPQGEAA